MAKESYGVRRPGWRQLNALTSMSKLLRAHTVGRDGWYLLSTRETEHVAPVSRRVRIGRYSWERRGRRESRYVYIHARLRLQLHPAGIQEPRRMRGCKRLR